jgi:hypothetical protein
MAELSTDIRETVRERYARAAQASAAGQSVSPIIRTRKPSSCCASAIQSSCCEPSAKTECCESGRHAAGTCGCQARTT